MMQMMMMEMEMMEGAGKSVIEMQKMESSLDPAEVSAPPIGSPFFWGINNAAVPEGGQRGMGAKEEDFGGQEVDAFFICLGLSRC